MNDRITELERQLVSTTEDLTITQSEIHQLRDTPHEWNAERAALLAERQDALQKQYDALHKEIRSCREHLRKTYERPTGGFNTILNALLPPLPSNRPIVNPTKEAMAALPSVWRKALFALVTAVLVGSGIALVVPWTRTIPFTLAKDYLIEKGIDQTVAYIVAGALIFGIIVFQGRKSRNAAIRWDYSQEASSFARATARVEHRFRLGAEEWSPSMRAWASLLYGVSHGLHIFAPAIIAGLAVYGFILTRIYVREIAAGKTSRDALLMSTKVNSMATIMLFISGTGYVILTIAWLFLFT